MDIFLIFIFNIFTGAVIYLILSLKIEKTSATYQEKKLRREMGEIITEFNSTAERNITILENKISILKKMMNENGPVKGIDITLLDDRLEDNSKKSERKASASDSGNRIFFPEKRGIFSDKADGLDKKNIGRPGLIDSSDGIESETQRENRPLIEKKIELSDKDKSRRIDLTSDEEVYPVAGAVENESEPDFRELFSLSSDKYGLIKELIGRGYSVEELSKGSGIPAGEIRLVISLNS